MLSQLSTFKKFTQLVAITNFIILAGWQLPSQAKTDDLYDRKTLIFFEVINVLDDDVLYIREFPSPRSRKIGHIPPNQSCVAYLNQIREKDSQTWVTVTYKGVQGWVNLYHLRQVSYGKCPVRYYRVINVSSDDVLNIRETATHRSRKLGHIPPTEQCLPQLDQSYASNNQKWVMLKYKRIKGWVNSYYLKKMDKSACR